MDRRGYTHAMERGGGNGYFTIDGCTAIKVRLVLDFRKLNQHVECYTGGSVIDIYNETMREWRQMSGVSKIVDLKSAFLLLHVSNMLWKYQLVKYKRKTYSLIRLGFALNSAPKIMSMILKKNIRGDELLH